MSTVRYVWFSDQEWLCLCGNTPEAGLGMDCIHKTNQSPNYALYRCIECGAEHQLALG